jgi:hypothetical protein
MRPVRTIIAVVFAAAMAITGCAAHSTNPPPVPSPPVVDQAPLPVTDNPTPVPAPAPKPTPTPRVAPVLADGHYDSYIRTVDTRHQRLVVDLVQVFHDQAAIDAAIAHGMPHDRAQVLYAYIRNDNPRLRTLPLARDLRIDLVGRGDCGAGSDLRHDMDLLISDVSYHTPSLYFTLTVTGGAVRHIKEVSTQPAC